MACNVITCQGRGEEQEWGQAYHDNNVGVSIGCEAGGRPPCSQRRRVSDDMSAKHWQPEAQTILTGVIAHFELLHFIVLHACSMVGPSVLDTNKHLDRPCAGGQCIGGGGVFVVGQC